MGSLTDNENPPVLVHVPESPLHSQSTSGELEGTGTWLDHEYKPVHSQAFRHWEGQYDPHDNSNRPHWPSNHGESPVPSGPLQIPN